MSLEWNGNGEWCVRNGKRGALIWKAQILQDWQRRLPDGTFPWAIQYETKWSGVMGWIPLDTTDRAVARRSLLQWAADFDRNEIEALLVRDAERRKARKGAPK